MANQPLTPPPPGSLLGSKRQDRLVGAAIGAAWWVLGVPLVALGGRTYGSGVACLLFIAFMAQIAYVARKPGGSNLVVAIILTATLLPVVLVLGLLGKCALHGF